MSRFIIVDPVDYPLPYGSLYINIDDILHFEFDSTTSRTEFKTIIYRKDSEPVTVWGRPESIFEQIEPGSKK